MKQEMHLLRSLGPQSWAKIKARATERLQGTCQPYCRASHTGLAIRAVVVIVVVDDVDDDVDDDVVVKT